MNAASAAETGGRRGRRKRTQTKLQPQQEFRMGNLRRRECGRNLSRLCGDVDAWYKLRQNTDHVDGFAFNTSLSAFIDRSHLSYAPYLINKAG
jgi:hypothetical protein